MRSSRRLVATTLLAMTCVLLLPLPADAQDRFEGLCGLFLHQEQADLEDLELAVQLDEIRLPVAEEIFALVDNLYQNEIAERLPYLGVKHNRDTTEISLQRSRQQLARQQAVVDQYRIACSAASDERSSDDPGTMEEAHARYIAADCQVRELDIAIYEVDLEYQQMVLEVSRDLRQNDVASRQQVLFDERDVEETLRQLEQARQRAARCRQ